MSTHAKAPLWRKGEFGNTTRSNFTSNIDKLLSQLSKVERTGHGKYIACCPSHNDKNPSLAIREDNGKILLHCFAGCSAYKIVSAVGLELSNLFPANEFSYSKPIKNPFPDSDVLRCLQFEVLVVIIAACNLIKGITLSQENLQRLLLSVSRIRSAYE